MPDEEAGKVWNAADLFRRVRALELAAGAQEAALDQARGVAQDFWIVLWEIACETGNEGQQRALLFDLTNFSWLSEHVRAHLAQWGTRWPLPEEATP
jgi:hypothetical protein